VTACPFSLCDAEVQLVPERERPGADPKALVRVPQHQLGGHSEFGLCPASLLLVPLSAYDAQQLADQADAIERILQDRETRVEPVSPAASPTPAPGPDPRWFTPAPGQGTKAGHGGYNAPPRAEPWLFPPTSPVREPGGFIGPQPPPSTGGNTGVSTVEEVKAAISAAGQELAEVVDALFPLEEQAGRALAALNTIRETSIDTMGAPQIADAIEKIGEANHLLRMAIEAGTTYKATML
jgi:hypothetical protein